MSPKQTFSSLPYVFFFLLVIYLILTLLNRRNTQSEKCCGCSSQCIGKNMSCPCYRRFMLQNNNIRSNNEYFQPAIGSDFTQYLDQVRKNQLKFSNQ